MPKRKKPEPPIVDFSILEKDGYSQRQIHVLHYLQQGFHRNEIGNVLGIQPSTVAFHLKCIGSQLGARGNVEIISRAIITCYLLSEKMGTGGLPLM